MELSEEVHNLLQRYKTLQKQNEETIPYGRFTLIGISDSGNDDTLIHVNELSFNDDETWLYESSSGNRQSSVTNLYQWLYKDFESPKNEEFHTNHLHLVREMAKVDIKKSFDSRTFTRPKKRFNRPSIEKYNEDFVELTVQNGRKSSFVVSKLEEEDVNQKNIAQEEMVSPNEGIFNKPLNFDLTQPTTSSIFDKIVVSAGELDSFQNMSPPSLVNSMCSSTFTNLMENSYIKNDPLLREIRDTDYSETVLLQDYEMPMYQSLTESFSSLNSENIDSYVKKHTCMNGTFTKNSLNDYYNDCDRSFNDTFKVNTIYDKNNIKKTVCDINGKPCDVNNLQYDSTEDLQLQNIDPNISTTPTNINGTYKKTFRMSTTFEKFNCSDDFDRLDATFTKLNPNCTTKSDSVLSSYSDTNRTCTKVHNLIDCVDDRKDSSTVNSVLNNTINIKNNSIGYLTGSADSLDHISSLSNSSRGSNKMLNMAEVDAIVELQEQSLQIISTPKTTDSVKKLWDNNLISPLSSEQLTDSDDDYTTVRSSLSKASSIESESENAAVASNKEISKRNPRSVNTLTTDSKILQTQANQFRSSCSNLKNSGESLKNSYGNLQKIATNLKGSYSNLKTLRSNLRGSYTSLKPSSTNLPVVPPILNPKSLSTSTVNNKVVELNCKRNLEAPTSHKENGQKPAKASGLPRPLSICTTNSRPVSRIPAPRSVRSATSRPDSRSNKQLNGCY